MTDRKEQIEMLNAAKADVQKQLDSIFSEESNRLINSISCMSQVDHEKTAKFLAQAIYAHFSAQDEAIRSFLIDSFSTAFATMADQMPNDGLVEWDKEDTPQPPAKENTTEIEAA